MISFQRLLGREDEFCGLLESSIARGVASVDALREMLAHRATVVTLHAFADARSKNKAATDEIRQRLITTFVTPMEREDIEALAEALYKIPKTVEKFAERYQIVAEQIRDTDFTAQTELMAAAVKAVQEMVGTLRDGRNLAGIRANQRKIRSLESQADAVLLELEREFYTPGYPPLRAIILKDLFSLNEKVVDRCRDAANVIALVILKNS